MSPASYQAAPPRADGSLLYCPQRPATNRLQPPWSKRRSFNSASRAGNGTRTRDPNLGKVVLYQLSYSREIARHRPAALPGPSGAEGDRTPDLVNAIHALSQLSYAPIIFGRPMGPPAGNTAT